MTFIIAYSREFMTVHREVSRQITQRTTRAKSKKKEDEGLIGLRKILREIIEKRNKTNKEKASSKAADNAARDKIVSNNKTFAVTKPKFADLTGRKG